MAKKKGSSEFQIRKEQLEDLQQRANEAGDLRAELDAIKEINKLCGLYQEPVDNGESTEGALARAHLEGTGLVEKGLPLEELARRIAHLVATSSTTKKRPEVPHSKRPTGAVTKTNRAASANPERPAAPEKCDVTKPMNGRKKTLGVGAR